MSTHHRSPQATPSRRRLLAGTLAGVGDALFMGTGGGALFGTDRAAAKAPAGPAALTARTGKSRKASYNRSLQNAGAGMHVGPDTAMGISTFALNKISVTCGVGSLGNSPGAVPMSATMPTGLATSGPFAMMMYSTAVQSFVIDRKARSLTATGTMRSITAAGSQIMEDVLHPFVAVGLDKQGRAADEFYLHFQTPFWNANNPMATKSNLKDSWAMFGSPILFGEINVV
ncbi:MAG TPA: hypothetical protein VHV82_19450 [Sporichthyaceae bacterium]|nr:hypothetical protein [Sporichthyaceae bacterium]